MGEYSLKEIIFAIIRFILKYLIVIIGTAILTVFLGYLHFRKQKVYYEANIYANTGLLINAKSGDLYSSALAADLKNVISNLTNKAWVKENLNLDTSFFKGGKVSSDKNLRIIAREIASIKITIYTYDKKDFERFKKGIEFYYKHKSPLLSLYKLQQQIFDSLKAVETEQKYFIKDNNCYSIIKINEVSKYLSQYDFSRPLFYFTSDFSRIKAHNTHYNYLSYLIIGTVLGVILSIGIEIIKLYLNQKEE